MSWGIIQFLKVRRSGSKVGSKNETHTGEAGQVNVNKDWRVLALRKSRSRALRYVQKGLVQY